MTDRLFTPRFFVLCGFSFTVFLSAFQLLPTAPFHILALGGGTSAAGLFLGFLTYSSAFSAPLTGSLGDRVGTRRVLIIGSVAITAFSIAYALIPSYKVMLALVLVHGVFWSGLLTGSAAYMTNILPEGRRAEGIAYWGLSTIAAIAVAPSIGFWMFHFGWRALCLEAAALNVVMGLIAWRLPPQPIVVHPHGRSTRLLEWRVLILSFTLFLYSFGYGGITSFTALYADANGVTPKGIYLTTLAIAILVTRPLSGRLGDRFGYRRVFLPCLVLISAGLWCLAFGGSRFWLVISAVIFGTGFGTAYPVFASYVMRHVGPARRGAAFGAILACFDTGIGTGSTSMGWIIEHYGFPRAFGTAALLSALALPYFLFADRLLRRRSLARSHDGPTASQEGHSDHEDH
ncbi:MAG TPA: MFS transporter [Vicinamibacterales bacterium]|nr:MFS transporter [Vicinamibacterales bacterium]